MDFSLRLSPLWGLMSYSGYKFFMAESLEDARFRHRNDANFPDTMWFMVKGAANTASPQAQESLESLCRAYWEPIYAFIRRTGKSPHDAEDLTQRFFMHLMKDNRLRHAKPEKGRFRYFLQRSIKNFLVDDWRRKPAPERNGRLIEVDAEQGENRYQLERADQLDPEKIFQRVWRARSWSSPWSGSKPSTRPHAWRRCLTIFTPCFPATNRSVRAPKRPNGWT